MKTHLRIGISSQSSGFLWALLFAVCGLGACTTQAVSTGTGGKGGTTGGTLGGMTGSSTGGSGGLYATSDGVLCPLPAQPLITDFTVVVPDGGVADAAATDAAVSTQYNHFGDATTLGGSEFVYPLDGTWPVTSDVSAGNWHISGTLGTYSGFGLYFDNCTRVNASAYAGISFTISGSVAQPGTTTPMVTMGMGTLNNVLAASWLLAHPVAGGTVPDPAAPGRCIPPATATNQYNQATCKDATATVPVTTTPTTITLHWADFMGGLPEAGVTPSDITSFYWFFPPPAGAGTATPTTYPVDITIDNLSFITP
jgi:hypothetical protein